MNKSILDIGNGGHKGNRRGSPLIYLALTVSYTVGIYWLSTIPGKVDTGSPLLSEIIAWTPPALQNLLHVPLFGLLAWLWYSTLYAYNLHHGFALATTFMLAAGFGVYDEWHQLHVPGRYASFTDIALNCTGVVLALLWIYRVQHHRVRLKTSKHPPG